MGDNGASLSCVVSIEWLNKQGIVQRKVSHKKGHLRLIRDDRREIFIQISADKCSPIKLSLKGISVHKKFMNEGKASIKFLPLNCTMFLSNAPPGDLLSFLRTIFVKMTGEKSASNANTSLRTQLLSSKPQQFEEISPVTNTELNNAIKKVNRASDTTPSPLAGKKRKIERSDKNGENRPKSAKRLYTPSPIPNEPLDLEQKEVLDACLSGRNIFFTGSAGTGKSYLLKRIIRALPPDVTVATASTGVAACHIGGITLHQFAGIGSGESSIERSVQLASKSVALSIWKKCKHLIIDEVSMVDGDYFEKIEQVARKVRNNEKPFGGIQLILCGDFFQLPPVSKPKPGESKTAPPKFCFKTKAWDCCMFNTFELKRVHRQTDDKFIKILNKIRIGRVDQEVNDALTTTSKQAIERDGILATRLCSHTKDADIINESKLKALPGDSILFEAQDSVPGTTSMLDQQTPVSSKLVLKVGAQVMLLKNINVSAGLVNGARGVVKEFREGLPVVLFKNKELHLKKERWVVKTASGGSVTRVQLPLKLAWAFSIHKSQGLTLDCVEMSLGRVFEAGQAYVALSRAQSLESLRVLDFKPSQVWANPDVLEFYKYMDQIRIIPLGPQSKNTNVGNLIRKKSVPKSKLCSKPLVTIS
nr:unnamed protein product [Callosobruchus chinensis]